MDKYKSTRELEKLLVDGLSTDPRYLSQEDIAQLCDVQRNTVRRWVQMNNVLPEPAIRIRRWNAPLYARDETLEALVRRGKIIAADATLKREQDEMKYGK